MKITTRILTAIYILAGLTYILWGDYTSPITRHILKGSLIPLLIIIFILNLRHNMRGINLLVLAGLVFSWAGDVVIDLSFVHGLGCFLIAQIMYLSAFFLPHGKNVIFHERAYLLILLLIAGMVLIYFIYSDLRDMKLPVIIYAFVILTMLASAFNRLKKVNKQSYILVLVGAFLFVISDSAIAVSRFTWDFLYSGQIIMITYLAAQYLIMTGYLKGINLKT